MLLSWEYRSVKAALLVLALASLASAQGISRAENENSTSNARNSRPSILQQVGIDQRIGQVLPLDAHFTDEYGKDVTLGSYFHHGKPVLLALVYYDCPMLCDQVLNGMASSLNVLRFDAGKEFEVLAVSFDPRETPKLALEKKEMYLKRYKRAGAEQGWHFLTGQPESIKKITEAAGFHYVWDNNTNQFAHSSAVILITPEGRVAQYYYGIEYSPKDMRLGIIEASKEKLGTVVDSVILYCYHYDPTTGKYGAVVMNLVRLAGLVTVLLMGGLIGFSLYRESRANQESVRHAGQAD
jgi:protein SCO1/2